MKIYNVVQKLYEVFQVIPRTSCVIIPPPQDYLTAVKLYITITILQNVLRGCNNKALLTDIKTTFS